LKELGRGSRNLLASAKKTDKSYKTVFEDKGSRGIRKPTVEDVKDFGHHIGSRMKGLREEAIRAGKGLRKKAIKARKGISEALPTKTKKAKGQMTEEVKQPETQPIKKVYPAESKPIAKEALIDVNLMAKVKEFTIETSTSDKTETDPRSNNVSEEIGKLPEEIKQSLPKSTVISEKSYNYELERALHKFSELQNNQYYKQFTDGGMITKNLKVVTDHTEYEDSLYVDKDYPAEWRTVVEGVQPLRGHIQTHETSDIPKDLLKMTARIIYQEYLDALDEYKEKCIELNDDKDNPHQTHTQGLLEGVKELVKEFNTVMDSLATE